MPNIYNKINNINDPVLSKNPKPKSATPVRPNFEKYTDPTGEFDTRAMKLSWWYVRHKVLLYRLAVRALIVFSVITWLFSLLSIGNYLIFGIAQDKQLMSDLSQSFDYQMLQPLYTAQPLQIDNTISLPGGVNKTVFLANVLNANERYIASLDYYFVVGDVKTPVQNAVIIPGEMRPLAYFGWESGGYGGEAHIVIENLKWKFVSAHSVRNLAAWQGDRLRFTVSDFKFSDASATDGPHASRVNFNLTNESAYGYTVANFYLALYQNDTLVGLAPLRLENFLSTETRAVDWRSFIPGLSVTDVKVIPTINIYDRSVYLQPPQS